MPGRDRHLLHMPSDFAAWRRAWPAMMTSRSSTNRGWVNPNRSMAEASCATCASECVRALPSNPVRVRTLTFSTAAYLRQWSVRTC